MNSIKIRTLTPWKYYLILFGTLPLHFLVVFLLYTNGVQRDLIIASILLLLLICVAFAHVVSRKWTTFSLNERIVQCDGETIAMAYPANYYIHDEGIGVTQFELKVKSEKKIKILVPKYGKNAKKLEEYLERICNQLNEGK